MCFVFPLGLLLEHNALNTYFVFLVTNYCDALHDIVVVNTVVGQTLSSHGNGRRSHAL